ncbi:MAG TPA: RDD family protein [Gammaproteobacteria bacterium]|nr:RDD family protein [Gammaproteobacteria bacterium]
MHDAATQPAPPARSGMAPALWRRLAAAFYDSLVLIALFIVATFFIVPFAPHGETLDAFYVHHPAVKLAYQFGLLALGFAFFGGFWMRSGQTVGMLAWKLRVVQSANGARITWKQALTRYLCAILSWLVCGLGFLWSLWDRERKTWHDRLSGTELCMATSIAEQAGSAP